MSNLGIASMRPPEFTGGNVDADRGSPMPYALGSFNEAAGIHRRKPIILARDNAQPLLQASMRPPEFTGGNGRWTSKTATPGGGPASLQ